VARGGGGGRASPSAEGERAPRAASPRAPLRTALRARTEPTHPPIGLRIKRVYEAPRPEDGERVLVDRLWPRGISKDKARIDLWLREIAPSSALRRGVHGGRVTREEFAIAYGRELAEEPARSAAAALLARVAAGPVTLLYAARDAVNNNAVVLKDWLEAHRAGAQRRR
jgi:uncharacterized protein YeaO (DUF488 family)